MKFEWFVFHQIHPPKFNSSPLKNGGWKTILSYWESNLSGAMLNFRYSYFWPQTVAGQPWLLAITDYRQLVGRTWKRNRNPSERSWTNGESMRTGFLFSGFFWRRKEKNNKKQLHPHCSFELFWSQKNDVPKKNVLVVLHILHFHPHIGNWSNLTSICFKWVETEPPTLERCLLSDPGGGNAAGPQVLMMSTDQTTGVGPNHWSSWTKPLE